jgi:hypothetical protein
MIKIGADRKNRMIKDRFTRLLEAGSSEFVVLIARLPFMLTDRLEPKKADDRTGVQLWVKTKNG